MSILRRAVRYERGYSLIEMLTVLVILGLVTGAITALFVQGSSAQLEMNKRFQAQSDARIALDRIRREVHCAKLISPTGVSTSVVLTMQEQCKGGTPGAGDWYVTWCVLGSGTRYAIYRSRTDPCNTSDARFADYLTRQQLFTFTAQSTSSLAKLRVELPVDVNTRDGSRGYELADDIVLRNSTRS